MSLDGHLVEILQKLVALDVLAVVVISDCRFDGADRIELQTIAVNWVHEFFELIVEYLN